MAIEKKIVIGAINITMQPHSPKKYHALFRDAYKLKKPVKISGHQYGILSRWHKLNPLETGITPFTGDIFKYTDIDMDGNWFNVLTNGFASESDLEDMVIKEHLKPNSSRFSYIFYPKQHIIFYEGYYDSKTLGPSNAERFFHNLLNQEELNDKYGKVDVTHVPSVDKLQEALKLKQIEKLKFVVNRPNPDDHATAEAEVLERMSQRNVSEFRQEFKAEEGKNIEMDNDLTTMAHISARNGMTFIKGKDLELKTQEFSTKSHPWTLKEYYDSGVELPFTVLARIANSLKDNVVNWFKNE
ncbi:MAG: DUF4747 family protein [Gammaproteobacteria bacterium]|nr:DUF4747 family protein [Gammaproteobacteria bacterium]